MDKEQFDKEADVAARVVYSHMFPDWLYDKTSPTYQENFRKMMRQALDAAEKERKEKCA